MPTRASVESDTLPPEPSQYHNQDPPIPPPPTQTGRKRPQWLLWALGSGGFAACNGVFAKLTTSSTTVKLATGASHMLGFAQQSRFLEYVIRAIFFCLNLLSNAIMWILFTRALTAATSTTRVSILNTSANFLTTAMLSMIIFSEGLPFTWWIGAALLVSGSVIIGAREGGSAEAGADAKSDNAVSLGEGAVRLEGGEISNDRDRYRDDEDEQRGMRNKSLEDNRE